MEILIAMWNHGPLTDFRRPIPDSSVEDSFR
jgi:hypothetical protein